MFRLRFFNSVFYSSLFLYLGVCVSVSFLVILIDQQNIFCVLAIRLWMNILCRVVSLSGDFVTRRVVELWMILIASGWCDRQRHREDNEMRKNCLGSYEVWLYFWMLDQTRLFYLRDGSTHVYTSVFACTQAKWTIFDWKIWICILRYVVPLSQCHYPCAISIQFIFKIQIQRIFASSLTLPLSLSSYGYYARLLQREPYTAQTRVCLSVYACVCLFQKYELRRR